MDSILELLYPKLILFVLGFSSSVSTCILHLLRYFSRFSRKGGSLKGMLDNSGVPLTEHMEEKQDVLQFSGKENGGVDEKQDLLQFSVKENCGVDAKQDLLQFSVKENCGVDEKQDLLQFSVKEHCGVDEKQDHLQFSGKENGGVDEKEDEIEPHEFKFTFRFPTFEEFSKNQKNFSQLLNFTDRIEVDTNSSDGFVPKTGDGCVHESHDDQREDDFADQECVLEQLMGNSSNFVKIGEIENKEEIFTCSEEELQKINLEYDEIVDTEDGFLSYESKIQETKEGYEEEEEGFYTFDEEKLKKVNDESVYSPTFDLHPEEGFLQDVDFELEFDEKDAKDEKEHSNWNDSEFLSENDFTKSGNENGKNSSDATNKLECLWEHQELIEQLKMEMKKVRAIGLPTILEESESPPKIMEELKPWRIEDVHHNGGGKMSEVHKFYRSYRERMRKFDIFNYQKMYTIGFLQLKDPQESSSSSKSSIPEISSLFGQTFITKKSKKQENDPTIKFIKELESDLEVVYVGQMCLSWEILHWQYEKALDIWESDTRLIRRFNDIADEFQQFQVLMQRFIEDEPFQGPRIQHYVKNRCVFRNLLQVPMIRDDHMKNKKARDEVVYDITSDALVEILEESIRLFWRFVRADKYKRQTPVEFQRPEDSQLFTDLQKDLHKKERKLKEQLRSGNCILKKLRSCREDETEDQVLYFFCQVDMKLVSRVLQMSTLTTDHLIWCHNKLSKVSFVNSKIHVEPSFFLFPC